jgi:hypothetical protein
MAEGSSYAGMTGPEARGSPGGKRPAFLTGRRLPSRLGKCRAGWNRHDTVTVFCWTPPQRLIWAGFGACANSSADGTKILRVKCLRRSVSCPGHSFSHSLTFVPRDGAPT